MITKIYGRSFKGQNFDQELGKLTIFVGRNGSGKTARTSALKLAIYGSIYDAFGKPVKQPYNIVENFGNPEETMTVGFESNKTRFTMAFKIASGSGISEVKVDGKKVAKEQVGRALVSLGDPRMLDLKEFTDLSDNEKISYLLRSFPPSGDLHGIEQKIEDANTKLNRTREQIRAAEQVILRLSTEKSQVQLPSGNYAENQAEIAKKESDLAAAEEYLKQIEIEERAAKEKAEANKRVKEAEEKHKAETTQLRLDVQEMERKVEQKQTAHLPESSEVTTNIFPRSRVLEMLNEIRKSMVEFECHACFAIILVDSFIAEVEGENG